MIASWLRVASPWLAVGVAAVALLAQRHSRATAIELAAVAALALLLPPLVYFVVYFCALHSLRHLRIAVGEADASSRGPIAGVALLYTVLTLVLAALVWPWLAAAGTLVHTADAELLKLVFIGLAALTLPHMLVVMLSERARKKAR